jgi:hypothetical protein
LEDGESARDGEFCRLAGFRPLLVFTLKPGTTLPSVVVRFSVMVEGAVVELVIVRPPGKVVVEVVVAPGLLTL